MILGFFDHHWLAAEPVQDDVGVEERDVPTVVVEYDLRLADFDQYWALLTRDLSHDACKYAHRLQKQTGREPR